MRAWVFPSWDSGGLPEGHSLRGLLHNDSPPPSRWGKGQMLGGGTWEREQVKDEEQCSEPHGRAEGSRS